MKSRAVLASLLLGVALVLSSAQNADAFGRFGRGCCEPTCGCEPSCCVAEPTCGCEMDCCETGRRGCCLGRLFSKFRNHGGCGCEVSCCEPTCCAAEPTCCAAEPTCCAAEPTCCAEPTCGCEMDCCDPCAKPRCCILGKLRGLFNRNHGCGCEMSCGCEPSCGIEAAGCGCN